MFLHEGLGEADVILGIRIIRENGAISLSQSHYIEKVIERFGESNCSPVSTPMDPSIKLVPSSGTPISQLEYASLIGSLMYAMTCTRPDIAFAVGKLSRFTSNPSMFHWQALRRVLKYLKKTIDYSLTYTGEPSVLEGYSDASWITNQEDYSSTSGWVFILGGGAISWASKKQTCITDSTMASEFIALASCCKEAEWLRDLLREVDLWVKPMSPNAIHCDSASTIAKAYSQVYNGKSRHIGVRHSYVRELIKDGVITIDYVRSNLNLADQFTKPLPKELVYKMSQGMGLKPIGKSQVKENSI